MSKMQITLSYGDLEKLLLDESGEIKVQMEIEHATEN
jgi:hypothetical protein